MWAQFRFKSGRKDCSYLSRMGITGNSLNLTSESHDDFIKRVNEALGGDEVQPMPLKNFLWFDAGGKIANQTCLIRLSNQAEYEKLVNYLKSKKGLETKYQSLIVNKPRSMPPTVRAKIVDFDHSYFEWD